MKNAMIALAAAVALTLAGAASAQDYVSAGIGGAFVHSPSNYTVSLGREFGDFRADAHYSEFKNEYHSGYKAQEYGFRSYYQPVTYKHFTPYVGAGLSHGRYNTRSAYSYDVVLGTSVGPFYIEGVNSNAPSIDRNVTSYSVGMRKHF